MKPSPGAGAVTAPRRDFFKETAALLVGGVLSLVPAVAGLLVWLDPVRRRAASTGAPFLRVATLEALPADAIPRRFAVLADKVDAWTRTPQTAIGAVYLRRMADGKVTAFNVVCPHAGCFVDYQASRQGYFCPCHNSTFSADGTINVPSSPSPRGLDEMQVEVRGRDIWVQFQNFQTGRHDKVPMS